MTKEEAEEREFLFSDAREGYYKGEYLGSYVYDQLFYCCGCEAILDNVEEHGFYYEKCGDCGYDWSVLND